MAVLFPVAKKKGRGFRRTRRVFDPRYLSPSTACAFMTPLGIEPRTLGLKVPLPFVLTVISMSLLCGGLFVPCTDVRQWAVLVVEPLQLPIVEDGVESCRDR